MVVSPVSESQYCVGLGKWRPGKAVKLGRLLWLCCLPAQLAWAPKLRWRDAVVAVVVATVVVVAAESHLAPLPGPLVKPC